MAYNPVKHGTVSSSKRYLYSVPELSGGLCRKERELSDNQLPEVSNMIFEDGYLVSRAGAVNVSADISGGFHSILREEFFGSVLFHCGTSLYRFDGVSVTLLRSDIPDTDSVLLRMNAKAYLITKEQKIYETDSGFICEETEPYIPTVIENASRTLETYDSCDPFNMMTKRIKCSYSEADTVAGKIYTVPFDIDTDQPIKIYIDGTLTTDLRASREGKKSLIVNGSSIGLVSGDTVTFEYTAAGAEEDAKFKEYFSQIYGCNIAFCFGGTSADGTRAFLTGNDDYPGMYFRSELKEPLFFPDTNVETLGDGSECVTAAEKRYEKLFFFTEKHIYAMGYSFSSENGAVFSISEVGTSVGCTMRGSVRSIDNTLVFADKQTGVYLLQSTDIFDELNVRHISANTRGSGESFAKGDVFCSCDHDRKYYIFDGCDLYIWDYGTTPYYTSGDHKKAEERLSWHRFPDMGACVCMFSLGGKLYFIRSEDGADAAIFVYDADKTFDSAPSDASGGYENTAFSCGFRTKGYNLGITHTRKCAKWFSFDYICKAPSETGLRVRVFGDGNEICAFLLTLSPAKEKGRIRLKLPPYSADVFSAEFYVSGARVGIANLTLCSNAADRVKHSG